MPAPSDPPSKLSAATPAALLDVGSIVGSYLIECELGRGGMGVVYRAKHVKLDKPVAIKVLSTTRGDSRQAIARLMREGETLARIRHPNILTVIDCGEAGGVPFLVLDFIEGGTVEGWLRREGGKLSPVAVRRVMDELLCGLQAAHEAGVIHRDLKPANLLLEKDGTLKISDFGLSQAFLPEADQTAVIRGDAGSAPTQVSMPTVTSVMPASQSSGQGVFGGTLQFMAPELHTQSQGDERSDIYAVGVIAYYVLTGRKPGGKIKPASAIVTGLPRSWDDFIDRCIAQQPEERFQSAEEARRFLRSMEARSWKKYWGVVCGGAVALVIGLVAVNLLPHSGAGGAGSNRPLSSHVHIVGLPKGATVRVDALSWNALERGFVDIQLAIGAKKRVSVFLGGEKQCEREVSVVDSEEMTVDFSDVFADAPSVVKPTPVVPAETLADAGGDKTAPPSNVSYSVVSATDDEIPIGTTLRLPGGRVIAKGSGPFVVSLAPGVVTAKIEGPGLLPSEVALVPSVSGVIPVSLTWKSAELTIGGLPDGVVVEIDNQQTRVVSQHPCVIKVRQGVRRLKIVSRFHADYEQFIDIFGALALTPELAWKPSLLVDLPDKQAIELSLVSPGAYVVGSARTEPGRQASDLDAVPVRQVSPFYIGRSEVTQGQYAAILGLARRQGGWVEANPSRSRARRNPEIPVEQVSFRELIGKVGFIQLLNEELVRQSVPLVADIPFETEWEIACRAGTSSSYNSGRDLMRTGTDPTLDPIAHYNKAISSGEPIPVRSKQPNAWGLYDMEGNVAEIVRSVSAEESKNTGGAGPVVGRIYARGGSWKTPAEHTRSSSRVEVYPEKKDAETGFRIVLRPRPPSEPHPQRE